MVVVVVVVVSLLGGIEEKEWKKFNFKCRI